MSISEGEKQILASLQQLVSVLNAWNDTNDEVGLAIAAGLLDIHEQLEAMEKLEEKRKL